jgi:organic hydroperoxide reductase OsmC/OhrA
MTTMTVQLRSTPDTKAALGWAAGHTIVVDRPDGKAGGMGLEFNGGQLLGLAIGGCFCNDLQYVAHEMGIRLASIQVDVSISFEGTPMLVKEATMQVAATPVDENADIGAVVAREGHLVGQQFAPARRPGADILAAVINSEELQRLR